VSDNYSLFLVGHVWHYRYKLPGMPRVQKTTGETVRRKADQVASDAYEAAKLRARGEQPCPTVSGLVSQWLESRPNNPSAAYVRSIETFGRCHLYDLAGMLLSEVRSSHVQEARKQHLLDHAPASANHWLSNLKMLFNWAVESRMIKLREWKVKLLRFQRKPKIILSPSDTMQWLEAVDHVASKHMATIIRIALGTGLREMECAGARWEWFDWDAAIYRPGITKGKEAKPRPLPPWLVAYLKPKAKRQGWVAPAPKGEPFSPGHMRRVMMKANARVGIKGLTPHRLRGSYITQLLAAGVPPRDVQEAVGHADVRTTFGYSETNLDRVRVGQDEIAARAGMSGRKMGAPRHSNKATVKEVR
jgi:integrase